MTNDLISHALDLAWSVWGELGVASPVRHHTRVIVDPEPAIVWTPHLAMHDARLRDEIFRWCRNHSEHVSMTRLRGLAASVPTEVRTDFMRLTTTLSKDGSRGWPVDDKQEPWSRVPAPRGSPVSTDRPALAAFRLRALAGVGARSDVLLNLLAGNRRWQSASRLAHLGYTKRSVARVLDDLHDAGFVRRRTQQNAHEFDLVDRAIWAQLTKTDRLPLPDWMGVWRVVFDTIEMTSWQAKPATVQRVEALKSYERLNEALLACDSEPPPRMTPAEMTTSLPQWAAKKLASLAHGEMTG